MRSRPRPGGTRSGAERPRGRGCRARRGPASGESAEAAEPAPGSRGAAPAEESRAPRTRLPRPDRVSGPGIPVFDIRLEDEDIAAVRAVLRSGWLTMGPKTEEFEAAFAEHLGVEHVVAVSSCTAALHLACIVAGVGPGDEVIVPSMTFVATANAVRYCGARPVFADLISTTDFGIDPDHVESLINERTKAVIPVHYAGYAVEIERLEEVCERAGVALIEDTAHAPDAVSKDGRMLGSIGQTGCFSFFPNKVLAVGEGGALATDSDEVAERVRRLRSQGMTATTFDRHLGRAMEYDVVEPGFNYRFDDIRASLILPRFRRLHGEIERRRELVPLPRAARRGRGGHGPVLGRAGGSLLLLPHGGARGPGDPARVPSSPDGGARDPDHDLPRRPSARLLRAHVRGALAAQDGASRRLALLDPALPAPDRRPAGRGRRGRRRRRRDGRAGEGALR